MSFYWFDNNTGIHTVDYSGKINYEEGINRMEQLKEYFKVNTPIGSPIRVLFDVRKTVWENVQTHNELSKIARKIFNSDKLQFRIYTAVLNNQYNNQSFDIECWFTNNEAAVLWLKKQK